MAFQAAPSDINDALFFMMLLSFCFIVTGIAVDILAVIIVAAAARAAGTAVVGREAVAIHVGV